MFCGKYLIHPTPSPTRGWRCLFSKGLSFYSTSKAKITPRNAVRMGLSSNIKVFQSLHLGGFSLSCLLGLLVDLRLDVKNADASEDTVDGL